MLVTDNDYPRFYGSAIKGGMLLEYVVLAPGTVPLYVPSSTKERIRQSWWFDSESHLTTCAHFKAMLFKSYGYEDRIAEVKKLLGETHARNG